MKNLINLTSPIALNPEWTQADFNQRALQIAAQLEQEKVQSVALWFEDAAWLSVCLLACFQAKVRVLLPPNLLPENQQWIEQNADLLLNDESAKTYGNLQKITTISPLVSFENDSELWLKTSGSSGEAKIIKKTVTQLWLEAKTVAEILPYSARSLHVIGSVSVQHFYGLTFRVLLPLWQRLQGLDWIIGREQLVYPEYLIAESKAEIQSLWISSPALLSRLNLTEKKLADCHLVGIISSGGALADHIGRDIEQNIQRPLIEIYGSSETGIMGYRSPSRKWQMPHDCTLGTDERGALWVESPRTNGREQTEDSVEFTDLGFVLHGRIDRIVKLGDKRVSLVNIEQHLQQHAWVKDAYVAQHPDHQRVVAWLALSEQGIEQLRNHGRKALIEQLKQALTPYTEKFALPRFWRFTDELPRNAQSKILRCDFENVCRQEIRHPNWHLAQKTENEVVFTARIPLDLVYLKGHFSNFPLVPGVVELQWAVEQIPILLGREIMIERVDNLKYQAFIRPHDQVELRLTWMAEKQRVKFTFKANGELAGSGLIIEKICNESI